MKETLLFCIIAHFGGLAISDFVTKRNFVFLTFFIFPIDILTKTR